MKTILQLGALAALLAATGCGREHAAAVAPATGPGLHPWTLPAGPGSAQPDLVAAPDGRLLLSWLDSVPGRRARLQYAEFGAAGRWLGPKTIGIGNSFVANWADTPHLLMLPGGALWIQWLQKSGASAEAYDVVLSTSRNDGMNWSEPFRPHGDRTATEHGFAALWAQGDDALGVAWLDGRAKAGGGSGGAAAQQGAEHAAHAGATALRWATIGADARSSGDAEIDGMACDCCQTAAATTSKGPLLVYRDRSVDGETETRDIAAVRFDGKAWSAPKPVATDGWKMSACPVNGPAVAAQGANAVVAWFTAANDTPTVKLARSGDAGDSFAAPVVVDQGAAVQGRVAVALDARAAWVLWIREENGAQSLQLARYAPDLSKPLEKVEVARLQGRGRGTGFPQLALRDGNAYVVWTDTAGGATALHGAMAVPKG